MGVETDDVALALNARAGLRNIDVVFTNTVIDPGTVPETISGLGGMVALRTAAAKLELVSSSASDAAAGTGARTVFIWGLDANWDEITETVTMNGVTPVQTVQDFLRVNAVEVASAGSTLSNVGRILIRDPSAGTNRSAIEIARGRAETGVFSVPRGASVLAVGWLIASRDATGNSSADVSFWCTCNGVRKIDWSTIVSGTVAVEIGSPHVFPEMSDVEVVCTRVLNAGTIVTVHGHGVLAQNVGTGL